MNFRDLPSVHELIEGLSASARELPDSLVTAETRRALDAARESLKRGEPATGSLTQNIEAALARWTQPSYRRVVNATGVILHTNLGRAPLAEFHPVFGYGNLEYDLATGKRGRRDSHLAVLLETLLGRPAIAVNNGAAALFLALNELASGGEAIVSRGELIEIGEGFRIPEIMLRSGAALREVGATNRTYIGDYRDAICDRTRVLLRVHPSNFRMTGFTARPAIAELVDLGRERGIPVYEDLGSGCLVDLRQYGVDEPRPRESLEAGVNLVSFSGDKMLGGPQGGILAGDPSLIQRLRRNPLFRALRQDKLFAQAMEVTLRHIVLERYNCVPVLQMIRMPAARILERAEAVVERVRERHRLGGNGPSALRVEAGESLIGGGSTPEHSLATYLIVLGEAQASAEEARLRSNDPPIIARIENDRVLLDLRTVLPDEEEALVQALS